MVSAEVRKLFMKISGRVASYSWRRCSTWRAMMSRKDSPRRTHSSDLARSMPIEVPRPPLSLITAVLADRRGGVLVGDLDVGQRRHVDRLDRRLGDHPGLAVLEEPVVVRERLDRDLVDARGDHLVARPVQPCATHESIVGLSGGRRNAPDRSRIARAAKLALRDQLLTTRTGGRWPRVGDGRPGASPGTCSPTPEVRRAATVAAYVSIAGEPGTGHLLDAPAARPASG